MGTAGPLPCSLADLLGYLLVCNVLYFARFPLSLPQLKFTAVIVYNQVDYESETERLQCPVLLEGGVGATSLPL